MTQYADLVDLPEDERIVAIGRAAESGKRVAFIVDNEAKAERYIEKLTAQFDVHVTQRMAGPVQGTVSVVVVRAEETRPC